MKQAILLAGFAHFGILAASATVPLALDWKNALGGLPPLLRQLFWVYGAFIVLMIVSFGIIILTNANELAEGDSVLAVSVNAMIAVFWFARLMVQFFVFDAEPHLKTPFLRCGYHALTVVFLYLALVHGAASIHGVLR
jgi:hypothetical protein